MLVPILNATGAVPVYRREEHDGDVDNQQAFETLYIDDYAQEAASPKKMVAPDLISGDLKELIAGNSPSGFDPAKRSAFVFRGLAIGDFAMAVRAFEQAETQGVGTVIEL